MVWVFEAVCCISCTVRRDVVIVHKQFGRDKKVALFLLVSIICRLQILFRFKHRKTTSSFVLRKDKRRIFIPIAINLRSFAFTENSAILYLNWFSMVKIQACEWGVVGRSGSLVRHLISRYNFQK